MTIIDDICKEHDIVIPSYMKRYAIKKSVDRLKKVNTDNLSDLEKVQLENIIEVLESVLTMSDSEIHDELVRIQKVFEDKETTNNEK